MSKRVPQSRQDLIAALREQLAFLEASGESFDAGNEGEAKRLAVVLRVLLHDTANSHSLLGTLGIKDTLRYWQVMGTAPENAMGFMGLSMGFTEKGMRYKPTLRGPKQLVPFAEWWNARVLYIPAEQLEVSRKSAILALANTDGGAHVDPTLDASYAALSRNNSFGWEVSLGDGSAGVVENSPALPLVRSAAHELRSTLMEQLPKLLPEW
jgi:hypothetical protein